VTGVTNRRERQAVVLDDESARLRAKTVVVMPRAPFLLDRQLHASNPRSRAEVWHDRINIPAKSIFQQQHRS
jgi:hypothetical protein